MRRNSSEIVAMRKLASSEIFDFTQYAVTYMGGDVIFEKKSKGISLKKINDMIESTIRRRALARLNGLALGGHISTKSASFQPSTGVSSKFYRIKNINEQGRFELGSKGLLLFGIYTKNLSPEDLDQVLSLGLEINKWDKHIKREFI